MTDAVKHTELPWTFQASEGGEMIWIGSDYENACGVPGYADHPGNIANAEFIVRACNSYYDMLSALQAVMDEWREGYGLRCVHQVRAAISKAEART